MTMIHIMIKKTVKKVVKTLDNDKNTRNDNNPYNDIDTGIPVKKTVKKVVNTLDTERKYTTYTDNLLKNTAKKVIDTIETDTNSFYLSKELYSKYLKNKKEPNLEIDSSDSSDNEDSRNIHYRISNSINY